MATIEQLEADPHPLLSELRATAPVAWAAVARSLGLAGAEPATVLRWYDAIVAGVSGVAAGRPVPAAAHEAFAELSTAVRAGSLEVAGDLTPGEVVSNAAVIMFGG